MGFFYALAFESLQLYVAVIEELDLPVLSWDRDRHHERVPYDMKLILNVPLIQLGK